MAEIIIIYHTLLSIFVFANTIHAYLFHHRKGQLSHYYKHLKSLWVIVMTLAWFLKHHALQDCMYTSQHNNIPSKTPNPKIDHVLYILKFKLLIVQTLHLINPSIIKISKQLFLILAFDPGCTGVFYCSLFCQTSSIHVPLLVAILYRIPSWVVTYLNYSIYAFILPPMHAHTNPTWPLAISGKYIGELKADLMATLYDVGGIIGDVTLIPFSRSIRFLCLITIVLMI